MPPQNRAMLIYQILRDAEWRDLDAAGESAGAAVDRADGFIHLSTAAQVAETARRHFAGEADLWLLALDAQALGCALKWEVSRGGQPFPHLYRPLRRGDARWVRRLPLGQDGHDFGDLACG